MRLETLQGCINNRASQRPSGGLMTPGMALGLCYLLLRSCAVEGQSIKWVLVWFSQLASSMLKQRSVASIRSNVTWRNNGLKCECEVVLQPPLFQCKTTLSWHCPLIPVLWCRTTLVVLFFDSPQSSKHRLTSAVIVRCFPSWTRHVFRDLSLWWPMFEGSPCWTYSVQTFHFNSPSLVVSNVTFYKWKSVFCLGLCHMFQCYYKFLSRTTC